MNYKDNTEGNFPHEVEEQFQRDLIDVDYEQVKPID